MDFYSIDAKGKTLLERRASHPTPERGRIYYYGGDRSVYYSDSTSNYRVWDANSMTALVSSLNSTGGINADTAINADDSDTLDGQHGQYYLQRKNLLINGNFDYWQRNTSFSTSGTIYTADRWRINYGDGSWSGTVDRVSFTESDYLDDGSNLGAACGANFFARFEATVSSGCTNVGPQIFQPIERRIGFWSGAETFTVSFWARYTGSPTNDILRVRIQRNTSPRQYFWAEDCTCTSSWQKFVRTIDTTSTIESRTSDEIGFSLPVNTIGNFDIAQIQLEYGSDASDFEPRHVVEELTLCQRYYYKTYLQSEVPGTFPSYGAAQDYRITAVASSNYTVRSSHHFPVTMRTTPTLTFYSPQTGASGKVAVTSGDVSTGSITIGQQGFRVEAADGVASTERTLVYHVTADAEL